MKVKNLLLTILLSQLLSLLYINIYAIEQTLKNNCSKATTDIATDKEKSLAPSDTQVSSDTKVSSDTEVTCMLGDNIKFEISNNILLLSKYMYKDLNFSPFFNVKTLSNPQTVRRYLLDKFIGGGQNLKLKDKKNNNKVNCTFFNRGPKSKKLIIIGTGFGNERERVAPFIHMFHEYDIIIFDYRGHGYDQPKILDTSQLKSCTIENRKNIKKTISELAPFVNWNKVPTLDISKTTFGLKEEAELLTVIKKMKEIKKYDKIFGIGLCFSGYIFSKVASKYPGIIDKLIIDSGLHSIEQIVNKVIEHPELITDPQRGHINFNTNISNIKNFLREAFSKVQIPEKTTGDYLSNVKIPVLFFHGALDILTDLANNLYKNIRATGSAEKAGFIFKRGRHLDIVLKYKEEYAMFSKIFFENRFKDFMHLSTNKEKLAQYIINNITDDITFISGEVN